MAMSGSFANGMDRSNAVARLQCDAKLVRRRVAVIAAAGVTAAPMHHERLADALDRQQQEIAER
jgi:hypothetical protein